MAGRPRRPRGARRRPDQRKRPGRIGRRELRYGWATDCAAAAAQALRENGCAESTASARRCSGRAGTRRETWRWIGRQRSANGRGGRRAGRAVPCGRVAASVPSALSCCAPPGRAARAHAGTAGPRPNPARTATTTAAPDGRELPIGRGPTRTVIAATSKAA